MQLISADDDGNIIVLYDSRWAHPELLGYRYSDPQYKLLQELWMRITGRSASPQNGAQIQKEGSTMIGKILTSKANSLKNAIKQRRKRTTGSQV